MSGVRGGIDLRAQKAVEAMQGVRGGVDVHAQQDQRSMCGLWEAKMEGVGNDLRAEKAAKAAQGVQGGAGRVVGPAVGAVTEGKQAGHVY